MEKPVSSPDSTTQPEVDLLPVRTVYGYWVAQVIKTKLESEGIPVVLRYQSVGHVLGITVDGLGQVEVLVPQPLADQAESILANVQPIEDLPADAERQE